MQFSSIWPIDRTLSGATTLSQSGPGSDGNERVLHIPQSSSITGISPSDCLMSYPGHSGAGAYPSAEMQSVYSTAYSPRRQGNLIVWVSVISPIILFVYFGISQNFSLGLWLGQEFY